MNSLEELKKENPFTVPEGYFEQLEENVMSQVTRHKKLVLRRKIITYSAAVAAVAVLLISVNGFIFKSETPAENLAQVETTTDKLLAVDNGNLSALSGQYPEVNLDMVGFDNVDYQILDFLLGYKAEKWRIDFGLAEIKLKNAHWRLEMFVHLSNQNFGS